MERKELYVDPRTKLFLLLSMNIVMLNASSGVILSYLRFTIGFLPFIMLLTAKIYKPAWIYITIYLLGYVVIGVVLGHTNGFLMMVLGFLSSMSTKFIPGGMLGVYFFSSTRINEFVAAMERMHLSQKIIIPISVMFRFFPTVKEEAEGISDAMRMRKLGFACFFSKPTEILEYRLVPLMISVVNIGEDLSASALTRCLGREKNRTNISHCGFGLFDYVLFLLGIMFVTLYFLELGGVF